MPLERVRQTAVSLGPPSPDARRGRLAQAGTMVEYALILANVAGTTFRTVGLNVESWAVGIQWSALTYALVALIALQVALWAFRPRDH
jgi:hypothetical protein